MAIQDFKNISTRLQVITVVNEGVDPSFGKFSDVLINGQGKEDGSPYRLSEDAMGRTIQATDYDKEVEMTSTEIGAILKAASASNIAFYAKFFKSYKYSDAAATFSEKVAEMDDAGILKFVKTKKTVKAFLKDNTQYGEEREGVFVRANREMIEVGRTRLREERFAAMKFLWDDTDRWAVVKEDEGWTIYVKHPRGRKALHHPHFYGSEEQANTVMSSIQGWIKDVEQSDASTDNPRRFKISSGTGESEVIALQSYVYPNQKAVSASSNEIQGRVTVADLDKPFHQNETQIATSNVIELVWNGVRYINKNLIGLVK